MSRWVRLMPTTRCASGVGQFVEIAGHELAVFRLDHPPRYIVIRNSCPHAGGNLAAGAVDGHCVECPWHHWRFDLDTGACTLSADARLVRYDVRVTDGFIEALLPDAAGG